MAAPPPPLNDDVTAEILLRLPPDEPEHLFRAALVCKPWLLIICDPGFRRRYREFHGAPPLLGLLHQLMASQGEPPARFASTTSIPAFPYPRSDGRRWLPLDCRHGRVLLHKHGKGGYLVWDPVTGDRHYFSGTEEVQRLMYSAAVLCATNGCDHLHCHGGPFRVVFVAMAHPHRDCGRRTIILASVYSSETRVWSVVPCLDNLDNTTFAQQVVRMELLSSYCTTFIEPRRGTLVGDAVYFLEQDAIVKYDFVKDCLSMIHPPDLSERYNALMGIDNNTSLGFACIQGSSLCMWSRKIDTGEAVEWVQYRVIELEGTIPIASPDDDLFVVGFAEGVGLIFVSSGLALFTINLNSGQVKKVHQLGQYFSVLPYMSFYLPEIGNGGGHEATDLAHSA